MNRSELIEALAARFEGNRKAAAHALEAVLDTLSRELARGEKIAVSGLEVLEKQVRAAAKVVPVPGRKADEPAAAGPAADITATAAPPASAGRAEAAAPPPAAKKAAPRKTAPRKTAAKKTAAKKAAAKKAPAKRSAR